MTPDANLLPRITPLLEVEQLRFAYGAGGPRALDGVSFTLQPGQFHALLGPNGAGKSTLFGLISRLLTIQRGDIRLAGASLQRAPARVLQEVGTVFQQSTLDLDLTVEDNLRYHASLHGIGGAVCASRIETELARLELAAQRKTRVRQLNGGHRRRVEIARALLHRPRLLLLDEATSGLDKRARDAIIRHIRRLCSDRGVGVLWATHLIEEVQSRDPVTLLYQGRVLADDTALQICRDSRRATLVEAFETLTERRPTPVESDEGTAYSTEALST
ncbi:ATP-binding cassette domain-containing protein [Motiliproteus sp. SC1-56]|uniref:ATP-binding cassette domain-containing protein n=1 Tax=Motiliproteus sp. SC1-56 TaxID=2799565 RepID=UPI001A8F1529|nr:ATP-binding cassette domain-containing protein [Motiliproteus sp. SC1-56]